MNFLRRWMVRRTLAKAHDLERRRRFEDAKPMYEAALGYLQGFERVNTLSRLGLCCLAMGRAAEARKHLDEAVKLKPDDAAAWLNYGRVLQDLGDTVGADEAFQKANQLAPDRPDILYNLAAYYAEKYTRAAVEAAKRAVRVTLDFMDKPGGPAELQALGFPPELPMVLLRNLALEKGEADDAIRFLNETADRPSTPATRWTRPAALLHLGLILANTGKYDQAIHAYRLALEADESIHPAHFNLAMAHSRKHEHAEAERAMSIYAERARASPVVAYGYGMIAEHKGDAQEAIRHYRGLLERHQKSPVSPGVLARLDVPRRWLEYAQRFIDAVTGGQGGRGEGEQWVGPGK